MRLIYLAGPYTSDNPAIVKERVRIYARVVAHFMKTAENLCLFSPILHCDLIATEEDLPHNFTFWAERDFFMIKKSSAMWVLTIPGWKESYGVSQEIEYARDINQDIMYVIPDPKSIYYITDAEPTPTDTIGN